MPSAHLPWPQWLISIDGWDLLALQEEKDTRETCQNKMELVDFIDFFFINEDLGHIAKPIDSWLFHFLVSAIVYEALIDSRCLIALFDKWCPLI